ncbi:MAG TPA: threonine dehydratase [Blastocatellia bacterium]|nr:threonine dehydratase [Blastocatellia bacterium]
MMEPTVSMAEILEARRVIRRYLNRTPLYYYAGLSELIGASVYVKHENHQPIGAFKVRGGINLISRLTPEERKRGVITASTGNHGQSIAYAAQLFGVRAVVVVPVGSNPDKVRAIQRLGAEVIFHGADFDEAREYVEAIAEREGYRYVHSANEPHLIAGVGTIGLEIVEDLPQVDVIIVPVGGGSGAAGISTAVKALNPRIEVIGVQSEGAPAAYLSWRDGRLVATATMTTFAEGLATRVGFEMTVSILRQYLTDFVLVSDDEIRQAMLLMMEATHNLVEGAGAAPLAAALKIKERLRGRTVVLDQSGGNITLESLRNLLATASSAAPV